MRIKFSFLSMLGAFLLPAFSFSAVSPPTDLPLPDNKAELKSYIQSTVSGRWISGCFGMVRNSGKRFHEGWDIRASKRAGQGKVLDRVYSVYGGKVVHVARENNGSYGKYVVIEHQNSNICFYSLYAHLNEIFPEINNGVSVSSGTPIGIMGNTSSVYQIKPGFEHLHFEVGLQLGEVSFRRWYEKSFPPHDKNLHASWNGLNLAGTDPGDFFREAKNKHSDFFLRVLDNTPTAFSVTVPVSRVPEIVKKSPGLLLKAEKNLNPIGWKIFFSWSGLPKKFIPVFDLKDFDSVKVENVSEKYIHKSVSRGMIVYKNGVYGIGKNLANTLEIIFGVSF